MESVAIVIRVSEHDVLPLSIIRSAAPPPQPALLQVESLAGEVMSRLASHPALLLPRAW
jgi:hypothetical protein